MWPSLLASDGAPSRPSRRQQEVTVPGASRMLTVLALHSHLFLAPRARRGLHGPPSASSSGMRALGFLPWPWRPHTHRPGSLSAPGAPHCPISMAGAEPCALAAQRLSGPNLHPSQVPRQPSTSQLSPKSPGRVVNTKATFSVLPKTYRTVWSIFCIWLSLVSC